MAGAAMMPPRILVVEDDADLLFLYYTALSQQGFEVIGAENAHLAMMELDNSVFDLMMADLNMPDAHGTTVIDHLRKDARHNRTEVIIVTANDHWLREVTDRGVEHILVKPVSMKQVVELVRQLTM
jgi:DNA-binding response OmpR family regulator